MPITHALGGFSIGGNEYTERAWQERYPAPKYCYRAERRWAQRVFRRPSGVRRIFRVLFLFCLSPALSRGISRVSQRRLPENIGFFGEKESGC